MALTISKLTALPDGNFGITIDGALFGEISATQKAAFVVYKNGKSKDTVMSAGGPVISDYSKTLEAGTHVVGYKGVKLNVVVKDLERSFKTTDPAYLGRLRKPNGVWPEGSPEENSKYNESVMDELMSRVVVTEQATVSGLVK